jgi:Cytochrome c554 and c-prime
MVGRGFQLWLGLSSLALLACSGVWCARGKPPASGTADKPAPDVRLLVVTDPKGYLEPCGCQQRPLGGVDKLAHLVQSARADEVPTLLLAAGDLSFGTELRPEDAASAATQEAWRADTLIKAWKAIGLSAATPGKLDLQQPPAVLHELVQTGGFPWLLENLRGAPDAAGFPARARVLDARGVKVGVFGVVMPDAALQLPPGVELDPELAELAARTSQALRAQGARVVVALVSGDRRSARSLAGKGPDVVVMGGLDQEQPVPPALHAGTIFVHAGRQGQRLVNLELELDGPGEPHDESAWSRREAEQALKRQAGELKAKIAEWEKAKGVSERDLTAQRERLAAMERSLETAVEPRYTGRWFSAEVSELSPEVPGDSAIAATLDAYDRRVNEHNRASLADRVPLPPKPGAPHYAGSESCKSCHEDAYAWWRKTKHGRAYATLEQKHKQFDLSCVGCHVVGYNQPGGSTVTHVENLKDVGCENCHGPGSQHNAEPNKPGLLARDTPEPVCGACHTHEHSDRFSYEAFKTLMIVPGHGLPPAAKGK